MLRCVVSVARVSDLPLGLSIDVVHLNLWDIVARPWVDMLLTIVDNINIGALINIASGELRSLEESFNKIVDNLSLNLC